VTHTRTLNREGKGKKYKCAFQSKKKETKLDYDVTSQILTTIQFLFVTFFLIVYVV